MISLDDGLDDVLDDLAARFAAREAQLHAFVPEPGRFDRLWREADALAAHTGPLTGALVGIKDVFHVAGFPTGAGSRLPPAELAGPEGPAVAALRAAGALFVGKTVATEFAYFGPGPTVNPHDPTRTPGGSSSGSAAAVAAGLCDLALGTQTIGSVIRPAAYCGVVGFKPSFGRISTAGLVPLAPSLDHVGLFTPTVAAMRRAAAVLCADWREPGDAPRPRLGVPAGPYLERAAPAGLASFRETAARLAAAGWEIVEVAAFADFDQVVARHGRVVAAEAARVHQRWFDRFAELYHPRTLELVERGRGISAAELAADLALCRGLAPALERRMDEAGIDLWISPAAPGPAPRGLESTGDPVMNLPWTQAGMPALGLPAGTAEGMPLAVQIAGRRGADELLLSWGAAIEKALKP